jgi:hypothetical protein
MPLSVWFGVKFTPGGHSTFFGLLNTGVHVVMYFYYMLAAMPAFRNYLWWKKYLTGVQMVSEEVDMNVLFPEKKSVKNVILYCPNSNITN